MFIRKIKQLISCSIVILSAAMMFSGCDTAEKIPEETTESTMTVETLSDEELDALTENMPEIVFVMSHHYDDTNILGFYFTNTGEMKMYDFRKIAPDEIYDLPDVYDRLEEATCSELDFSGEWGHTENMTENDMVDISNEELTEYYKKLLLITKEPEYEDLVEITMEVGHYRRYGIVNDSSGEQKIILLGGWGADYHYHYRNGNQYCEEVYNWIIKKFPRNLFY
ncbi:MAG: hypothetical protein K2N72_07675 [Oscillospiraceae bacterium]|nr:hypothetical protein [Oscillospiraceae bacterium]